ncbi:hypothetical protein GE21DRAFT_1339775 [Neurospora crassa]|nr:hypothetical protein GE21DRAFT_1339775 [Neurospora crassa]
MPNVSSSSSKGSSNHGEYKHWFCCSCGALNSSWVSKCYEPSCQHVQCTSCKKDNQIVRDTTSPSCSSSSTRR